MLGLGAIATVSATAGALLAVSLGTTPLMQHRLSPEEAAIFSKNAIANSNFHFPALSRPVNILILGVKVLTSDVNHPPEDLRKKKYLALVNSFEGLADTMLLLRLDPSNRQLTVLSIPRDTRTYVDGLGVTKINAANAHGGPALSALSVSELLDGISIDRYVRVNVQGVEKLINALGGLTVDVPTAMRYQDDSQHLYINLKAGKQHLNGDQVLQLLRFRHDALGDIGRIKRQQLVMKAFSEQALNPLTLARLPQIIGVIQSHIDTNLTLEELVAMTSFGTQVNRSEIQFLTLPGTFSEPGQYNTSYWLPDHDRIGALMQQRFDVQPLTGLVPTP
jgi:LCP family protein required for cell wall assembly